MEKLTRAQQRERLARLLVMPPIDAARELETYGVTIRDEPRFHQTGDEHLERALLGRNAPVINLALARNALNSQILKALYVIGQSLPIGDTDAAYKAGLRSACLGNCVGEVSELSAFPVAWIGRDAFCELVQSGDIVECDALLSNPSLSTGHLVNLYQRDGPFAAVDDLRWTQLIEASTKNPRFVTEIDYGADGPDLGFLNLHRAVFQMFSTFPMTWPSTWALTNLFHRLNPFLLHGPDGVESVRMLLNQWRGILIEGFGNKEQEGDYTDLSWMEEMRCLVASFYGRAMTKNADGKYEWEYLGSVDSPDLALRCGAYGKRPLSTDEMKVGFESDGQAFALAALSNSSTFSDKNRRYFEETCLQGSIIGLYTQRCEQFAKTNSSFDVRPITESGRDLAQDLSSTEPSPAPIVATELEKLQNTVVALQSMVTKLQSYLLWGLIILGALLVWRH